MVKIRLSRKGTKNKPIYRIVAIDESRKRGGKPLDVIGYWKPAKDEKRIDKKKLKMWISQGAQVTRAVEKIL
jgi:small subunit ribosomal protein S16